MGVPPAGRPASKRSLGHAARAGRQASGSPLLPPGPGVLVAALVPEPPPPPWLRAEGGGLGSYALAIHCGGCMIDQQKMRARILDLQASGAPVT